MKEVLDPVFSRCSSSSSSLSSSMLKVSIHVCDERVLASPKAGNIGVLFDESLNKIPQVTAKCKSAFYHLRKISLIRRHLTFDAVQLLVHALVTSMLDYCNPLLYGSPKHVIEQLQRMQNAAARVVTLSPKFCHVTLFLRIFIGSRLISELNLRATVRKYRPSNGKS